MKEDQRIWLTLSLYGIIAETEVTVNRILVFISLFSLVPSNSGSRVPPVFLFLNRCTLLLIVMEQRVH